MGLLISPETRARHAPQPGMFNISMDFNAAPSGRARGTEVIIPDNAPPAVRAAAESYNARVADFARANGITDYPVRGVRTRSENGRGVSHTIHTEPFFNSDADMQRAILENPAEFAAIYRDTFGSLDNARLIAPHGVGGDRGAASEFFGDETTFGEMMANYALGNEYTLPETGGTPMTPNSNPTMSTRSAPQGGAQAPQQAAQEPQSIWDRLGILQDEDRRQRLAIGLEGMTLNPNQALIQSLQGDIQARAEAQEEQQAQAQAQERRNRTAEWLRDNGSDDLASALEAGGLGGGDALKLHYSRQQEGAGYRQVRGADLGMTGESAERIFNVGPDGKVTGIGSSSTSVNVNTGDQGPQIGTIPQGYQIVNDSETDALRMEPIPGGPVEQEEREEADAKVQSADTLLSTINSALEDPALDKAVGVGGRINELLGPFAPEAARGQSYVDQLSGQVFLDAYNELRGGGTITEIEGQRAEAAKARLNENLSPEDFRAALTELKRVTENARARALGQPIPHPKINASPDGSGFAPTGSNGGATHRYNPATEQVEPIE